MPSAARSGRKPISQPRRALRSWLALGVTIVSACSVYSGDLAPTGNSPSQAGSGGSSALNEAGSAGKIGGGSGGMESPNTIGGASEGGDGPVGEGGMSPSPSGGSNTMGAGTGGTIAGGSAGNPAGTAGTGGMPSSDLIDDFEDKDLTLKDVGDRSGVWYLFNDGTTGTQAPMPLVCAALKDSGAPAELGNYGLEMKASGFTDYGSGLGVDFIDGKLVYDASKYTGVRFWAKAAGTTLEYRFQMPDATTDPAGKKCDPSATAAMNAKCNNHFGIALTFTAKWAQYTVPFSSLKQQGSWGERAAALDSAHVYGLQLTAKAASDVDLWVDQFEFTE